MVSSLRWKYYLKLKGLDEIIRRFDELKNYIPSFIDFVFICEGYRPKHKYILDIFNLKKVIHTQMQFNWNLMTSCHDYERRIDKLEEEEEEATKQRVEKLKQESLVDGTDCTEMEIAINTINRMSNER